MRYIWIMCLSLVLISCGWHLRGQVEVPPHLRVMAIEPQNTLLPLQRTLRSALKMADVQVVSMASNPHSILYIIDETVNIRVWVLNLDSETQENLIRYELKFKLTNAQGSVLLPEQSIVIEESQRVNPNTLLSQSEETNLLVQDIRENAVQQLMRRLSRVAD